MVTVQGRIASAVLGIVLSADVAAMAQQRVAQSRASQAASPAPASPLTPGTVSGFNSSLRLRGRPAEPARPPIPPPGVVFPGFPFLWGWHTFPDDLGTAAAPTPLPDDAPRGGVQLDVLPWRARVFLDGVYAGQVDDFNGYYQHLEAVAGPHRVVIVEPGYQPLVIDLVVSPGRTTTHRATLSEELRR